MIAMATLEAVQQRLIGKVLCSHFLIGCQCFSAWDPSLESLLIYEMSSFSWCLSDYAIFNCVCEHAVLVSGTVSLYLLPGYGILDRLREVWFQVVLVG